MTDNTKIRLDLTTVDGNIFYIMGAFSNAARQQGWSSKQISEVTNKVMEAGSYDEALAIIINNTY